MKKKNYNCAQNVLNFYAEKYNLDQHFIDSFEEYGFGKSPNGDCGALFAAKYLLQGVAATSIEKLFLQLVGETKCKSIRAAGKVSCKKCIEIAIELLRKQINSNKSGETKNNET